MRDTIFELTDELNNYFYSIIINNVEINFNSLLNETIVELVETIENEFNIFDSNLDALDITISFIL